MAPAASTKRKRINFMIDQNLVEEMTSLIPSGERSDFVNEALENALTIWSRKKAFELIDEANKTHPLKTSTEEILNIIQNDRRF